MKDYRRLIEEIKNSLFDKGIEKIVAFSGSIIDEEEINIKTEKIIEDSFSVFKDYKIALQTGGTDFDIQRSAVNQAKKYNIPVIGIYPSKGAKYRSSDLDFALEIDSRYGRSEWGDESELFAKIPDAVEIIGGKIGTLIEFGHITKVNDARMNRNKGKKVKEKLIYIAPIVISGVEFFTDSVYKLNLKDYQKKAIPEKPFENGKDAALYLVERLNEGMSNFRRD